MMWAEPGGWPDLHGFVGLWKGKWMNAMNTMNSGENRGYKHTHTRKQVRLSSLAGNTNSIEFAGRDPKGRVPNKEIDNTQIEFQRARDQPKIELQSKRSSN